MRLIAALALAASISLPSAVLAADDAKNAMSSATFSGMKLRNIGPAYMSGRISDIEVDQNDPATWYVAVSSGGVWKTENAGTTWTPLFDKEAVYSTGDVTMDPSNPNIIWVGTGENNGGRHISFGDGVYRSDNGGKTWKNMGLKESEHISDIIVHPTDSNTVWVSAQGPLWSKGGQRGLYKTTDGGKTWRNTLEVDEWTGVTSLVIDNRNPDKLYAATWQRQRTVASYVGTGPGTAIYTSDNGGETWQKLSNGLPKGNMGKIGLAISPINPDVVYAVIELDERKGGFYRSDDRGASWTKMSDEVSGGTGPHYYQEIWADPHRFDRVYIGSNYSKVSNDGGKTWIPINNKNKHVDDHAMAFHPTDPDFILIGSDGGIYESNDSMKKWRFIANLPLTQFYKIAVDDAKPFYNVYGGSQDNSTQGGPSRTDRAEGIKNSDWFLTLFADGHQPATEPGNPDILYSQWQQGSLARHDRKTGEIVIIQPQARPGEPAERFNWDAPINVSQHDPKRIYHASQRVWRSDDRGDSWTPISPDLTRNENRLHMPVMDRTWSQEAGWDLYAMSNYNTIANFAESAVDENILYVGTDDGLIQVTEDGGQSWKRYEIGKIKGIPATAYVNDIRADLFDKDTVYAALDNHKYGDYKPYLIKSTDRGKTWKSIASNLPDKHLVWRIVQDHVNKDLLFIGTEFGLFFTLDGGKQWVELTGGVPTISFRDVQIQRRENDLVAGSFGRGIYILDDYTPLRDMTAEDLEKDVLLFPSRTAPWYIPSTLHSDSQGDDQFAAPNPEFGATMTYYLKDSLMTAKDKRVKADKELVKDGKGTLYPAWDVLEAENRESKPAAYLLIKDSEGNVVRRVNGPTSKGIHRVTWDLRYPAHSALNGQSNDNYFLGNSGSLAAPGTYTATLYSRVNGAVTELAGPVSFDVEVMRSGALEGSSPQEVAAFARKTANAMRAVSGANATISNLHKQLGLLRTALDRSFVADDTLNTQWEAMRAELFAIEEALGGQKSRERKGATPATIESRIFHAMLGASSTYGPTKTHREQFGYAMDAFGSVQKRLNVLSQETVPAFQKALEAVDAPWTPGAEVPAIN
ncbi:hypothetical protein GCM10017044_10620 [Kordiimonas sediminis]|uniref:Sortilin N-terminal domain-containing protein n=1 Tax=Kordiimonas sediminis TaxID=1735581 RepID=A0A919E663_9PROT|nr:glycosyl hydrolase [Kordiimonas sediminis]GHF17995.1 hypothetical protein GCM10017044_10620 [Kordiimonas sediminis]